MTHEEAVEIAERWQSMRDGASFSSDTFSWDGAVRALEFVPTLGIWIVTADSSAVVSLQNDDRLFIVSAAPDGRYPVSSQPLRAKQIIVSMEWGAGTATESGVRWPTTWRFRYVDSDASDERWQLLVGAVEHHRLTKGEKLDPPEILARAIAAKAGWTVGLGA